MVELRQFDTESTFYFPLVSTGTANFDETLDSSAVPFEEGDVKYSLDGATFTNAENLPTHIGEGIYSLTMTAVEMTAAHIVITIKSQNSPKDWEDQAILVDTFGDTSAALGFYLNETIEDGLTAILMSDLPQAAPSATASIIYAINYLYELGRNRSITTAAEVAIYKDDGTTKAFKTTIMDNGTEFIKGEMGSGA